MWTRTRHLWGELAVWLGLAGAAWLLTYQFDRPVQGYRFGATGWPRTILVLIAYFNSYVSGFKAERREGTALMKPAFEAKVAAKQRLEEFGWIDREAGTVHIPLNNAIDKVVNEYGQRQSQAVEQTESDVQG